MVKHCKSSGTGQCQYPPPTRFLAGAVAFLFFTIDSTRLPAQSPPAPAEAPAIDFAFINASPNTRRAAGGHCAFRFGDRMYHFLHKGDLLLMQREPWSLFERRNRILENRTLTVATIGTSPSDSRKIKRHFDRLYLAQLRHLDRLEALQIESEWHAMLAGEAGAAVRLPTLGLFQTEAGGDAQVAGLKARISRELGHAFLAGEIGKVIGKLSSDAATVSQLPREPLRAWQDRGGGNIAGETLRERLLLLEALRVLQSSRPLAADALVTPNGEPLSTAERRRLERWSADLEDSVIRLLRSPRPDRGEPLLVTAARYAAARQSLSRGRWCLLGHPSPDKVEIFDAKESRANHELVAALGEQAQSVWLELRARAGGGEELDEVLCAGLERTASHFVHIEKSAREGTPLYAVGVGPTLPGSAGAMAPLDIGLSRAAFTKAQANSSAQLESYHKALSEEYNYRLRRRNCATELVDGAQGAFPDRASAERALGGYFKPGSGGSFIPGGLLVKIQRKWRVNESVTLPCFRQEQVEATVASEPRPLQVRLRESNTLTSTTYPGSIHDDKFLFFADGKVLLRPLQGVANFGYGLLHTGAGLVIAPADRGDHLKRGLQGMVFSVPEAVGISIRRGHYDLLPIEAEAVTATP